MYADTLFGSIGRYYHVWIPLLSYTQRSIGQLLRNKSSLLFYENSQFAKSIQNVSFFCYVIFILIVSIIVVKINTVRSSRVLMISSEWFVICSWSCFPFCKKNFRLGWKTRRKNYYEIILKGDPIVMSRIEDIKLW